MTIIGAWGRGAAAGLRSWLGGGPCVVCHAWQAQAVCVDCCERFAAPGHRCHRCGIDLPAQGRPVCGACVIHPPPFSQTVVALPYRYPWDGLLTRLKFQQAVELAGPLAELLGDAVGHALVLEPQRRPALVLPVPLSIERQRERGYNQAWELTRRVARRWQIPARPDGLLRLRSTVPQLSLPRSQRLANVRGAFALDARWRPAVQGQQVALVDDVMTTGATLTAAADALLRAGAADVQLWVVARTPVD
jgi:ComF family protein